MVYIAHHHIIVRHPPPDSKYSPEYNVVVLYIYINKDIWAGCITRGWGLMIFLFFLSGQGTSRFSARNLEHTDYSDFTLHAVVYSKAVRNRLVVQVLK